MSSQQREQHESLVRAPAVARSLDIPLKRVYMLAACGVLPVVRMGAREIRFEPSAVRSFIAAGGVPPGTVIE